MIPEKKISPQAIVALKEALSVIYWKKEDLQDFIKMSIDNKAIVGTINWNVTKRESVKELIERMLNRQDIYKNDLLNLLIAVTDFNDYNNLKFFDEDGTKIKRAKEAVERLRKYTYGYIHLTQEQEEAKRRKVEAEKKIIRSKSLDEELLKLREKFNQIAKLQDLQKRGYELERFLYDLFLLYELDPKGSFKIYGEQIDGAFTFQSTDYLLEAKWKSQVDRGDLASFCYKVETKFKLSAGLLVSMEGVTKEAISSDFKSIIIMDASDVLAVLDGRVSLPDLLFKKRRKAVESGEIYVPYSNLSE
jgi:hypothetical protein